MTTSTLVNTIQELGPLPSPLLARLSEGWHHTERWGEVFVAPGGSAWVIQQNGDRLTSVSVTLDPSDIIKTPLLERRKQAITKQSYRKRQSERTQTANFQLSEAEGVDK